MSWRDTTAQPVQDAMDDLLDAALILAGEQPTQRGEFYPLGMVIDASSKMSPTAARVRGTRQRAR